ncbi:MAG: ABC transporter permease [Planctomycetia bacterium]
MTDRPANHSSDWIRYPRLWGAFARYCLVREMTFRWNFLARCVSSVMWLGLILLYFHLIFRNTKTIGSWTEDEYLVFMGTSFLLNAILDVFFLGNCTNLSELIRTGNLDFALLKPIDEQFLLSCQRMDWATTPDLFVGAGLVVYGCWKTGVEVTPGMVAGYLVLLGSGVAVMYSLLLMMASSSVWIIRNQGLYELWFYVTLFARYPADVYDRGAAGTAIRTVLTFILPVMLAVTAPAEWWVRTTTWHSAYLVGFGVVALLLSRWFFFHALRAYRSASS